MCTQKYALQPNSVPNIETTLNVACRPGQNGNSKNLDSNYRDSTV